MSVFFDLPDGLTASIRSFNHHQQALLGNRDSTSDANNWYGQADTLLKLLLRIQALQESVIEILLGKILVSASESTEHDDTSEGLAMQILNHIRWCDVLFDPESVVNVLLEGLQVRLYENLYKACGARVPECMQVCFTCCNYS